MTTGADENGLIIDTYSDVLATVETALKTGLGAGLRTDAESVAGALIRPFAQVMAETNQGLQEVATSLSINAGEGSIGDVGVLNGITRIAAVNSTVTLRCTSSRACTIPAGSQVSTSSTSSVLWETDADLTLGAGASGNVAATCKTGGAIAADNGTLTTIRTPVYGWASVTNQADAVTGNARETIEAFRIRQIRAASRRGSCSLPAIERAILDPSQGAAVAAVVKENSGPVTDADGVASGGIWAVVQGGTDSAVATALYNSVSAGTPMKGDVEVEFVNGTDTKTIYFDRPTQVFVDVLILYYATPEFPSTGLATISQNIIDHLTRKIIGQDVRANEFYGYCYEIPGIEVIDIKIREHGTSTYGYSVTASAIEKLVTQTSYITAAIPA